MFFSLTVDTTLTVTLAILCIVSKTVVNTEGDDAVYSIYVLAGKERHPGEPQVVRVHKHVLDEQVWTAAVLQGRERERERV